GGERGGQLATGAHIEVETLVPDDPSDRLGQERLAGVIDVEVTERGPERGGARAHVGFVEDVGGRTEAGGQLVNRHAADLQHTIARARNVGRPQHRDQGVHVVWQLQPGWYGHRCFSSYILGRS